MLATIAVLILAAALELGGDAAIRRGLIDAAWTWLALGAVTLVAYGVVVNANRSIEFGRLMGTYIAVFFLVSQLLSIMLFGERPSPSVIVGGAFIVVGGLVIQAGTR